MGKALESVVDPKLEPELKPGPELKLILGPGLELEEPAPVGAPKLAGLAVTSPAPGVPITAARRVVLPRISRTGRGTICARSAAIIRMPNSISRERFNDSSVRSAEMRAERYVEYPKAAMIARISIATRISTKVNPEFARNLTVGSFTAWPEEW